MDRYSINFCQYFIVKKQAIVGLVISRLLERTFDAVLHSLFIDPNSFHLVFSALPDHTCVDCTVGFKAEPVRLKANFSHVVDVIEVAQ